MGGGICLETLLGLFVCVFLPPLYLIVLGLSFFISSVFLVVFLLFLFLFYSFIFVSVYVSVFLLSLYLYLLLSDFLSFWFPSYLAFDVCSIRPTGVP